MALTFLPTNAFTLHFQSISNEFFGVFRRLQVVEVFQEAVAAAGAIISAGRPREKLRRLTRRRQRIEQREPHPLRLSNPFRSGPAV